jgi:hypothetical protein
MASGILIGEGVRIGASVEGGTLRVTKVSRVNAGDEESGQPRAWTFIEFEIPDTETASLANSLSSALSSAGGWYCDFRSLDETFVVFAGRIFRYPRGDRAARAEAEEYARSVGVPDGQIDWPE